MSTIRDWLAEGDLRSDGLADQVVKHVLEDEALFEEVYLALYDDADPVRGHAADALEKIARTRPEWFVERLPDIIQAAQQDPLPMVRWHLAMILGHLAVVQEQAEPIIQALLDMLQDRSVFVASWAIVSLCIWGRLLPERREPILQAIVSLRDRPSAALRTKVRYAVELLTHQGAPFPEGWIKSEGLRHRPELLGGS